jgi:hypothetical protein
VIDQCRKHGIPPPEFEEITGATVVTFRANVGGPYKSPNKSPYKSPNKSLRSSGPPRNPDPARNFKKLPA